MKLSDKIYHCRKKANLSQEALAEKIGVSRQAISKWETGEAAPEISKLPLLARTFGVTADWLLDDAAEPEAGAPQGGSEDFSSVDPDGTSRSDAHRASPAYPEWVEHLPGLLGRLVKRFGWLIGVYVAVGGASLAFVGAIGMAFASSMSRSAANSFSSLGSGMFGGGSVTFDDASGALMDAGFTSVASTVTQPFEAVCIILTSAGLIVFAGGALLAWYLKKKGKENA